MNQNLTKVDRTLDFVRKVKNLLVWVVEEPHFMMIPPRAYHAVLTFSTASHMGIRVVCYDWAAHIVRIAEWLTATYDRQVKEVGFLQTLQDELLLLLDAHSEGEETEGALSTMPAIINLCERSSDWAMDREKERSKALKRKRSKRS